MLDYCIFNREAGDQYVEFNTVLWFQMVTDDRNALLTFRDRKSVLVTLIRIQEMIAKKLKVHDAPLRKELELLNGAIGKQQSDAYVTGWQKLQKKASIQ